MMLPKSRLGRSVEVHRIGLCGQSMIHGSHENFREWWCDRDAPVVVWFRGIPLALIQGYNFGCSPGLGGCRGDRAGIQEVGKTPYTRRSRKF
jgi:hypothetical protein